MHRFIIRRGLADAFYFSFLSFIVVWFAGFLYTRLERTTGGLNMGVTLIIILGIILLLFLLSITNIVLSEPHDHRIRIRFWERVIGVFIFIIASAVILGILGFLFWFKV